MISMLMSNILCIVFYVQTYCVPCFKIDCLILNFSVKEESVIVRSLTLTVGVNVHIFFSYS